jgi:uncharacterized metal-binding protein YceD (DUF177 family)
MTMEEKQLRQQFKVRISGIELGKHCFSIDCDKEFFDLAGIGQLEDGCLKLRIEMEKSEKMVDFHCHFEGAVVAECDRCLAPVTLPMNFDERLIVKLVSENYHSEEEQEDDIWMMDENTYEIDLFHFVYESVVLALPIRIVHEDDADGHPTCDPEVMRKLVEMNAENVEKEQGTDPRWDALKNIKLD